MPLVVAAERFGMVPETIAQRLDNGWPDEAAVKTPVRLVRPSTDFVLDFDGETLLLADAARRFGVPPNVLRWRLYEAVPPWPVKQALGLEPRVIARKRSYEK